MNYPTLRCGCEYGENCDKVSLCALNNAVEEKDEEIEELNAKLKRLQAALERIANSQHEPAYVLSDIAREALRDD
jgi:hypothetical protein